MTTSIKWNKIFIGVFAVVLTAALLTSCGKKGQKEFELGQAAYVAQDYKTAVTQFALAANKGHAEAQYQIGVCYAGGEGVTRDMTEAIKWWRQAADNGNADAMCALGAAYHNGFGVKKDDAESVKWIKKAVDKGNADAMCALGDAFQYGIGEKKDIIEAYKWYSKAAKQGNTEAQDKLASLKVVEYFEKAEKGDVSAMHSIGVCYIAGSDGVEKDMAEGVKWFKKAVENAEGEGSYGAWSAMIDLSVCYKNGFGVKKDDAEAEKWFKKVVELSHNMNSILGNILVDVGSAYEFGWGYGLVNKAIGVGNDIKTDRAEAIKWYKAAAEMGYEYAEECLRRMNAR